MFNISHIKYYKMCITSVGKNRKAITMSKELLWAGTGKTA